MGFIEHAHKNKGREVLRSAISNSLRECGDVKKNVEEEREGKWAWLARVVAAYHSWALECLLVVKELCCYYHHLVSRDLR